MTNNIEVVFSFDTTGSMYREHPTFLNGSKVLAVNPYIL